MASEAPVGRLGMSECQNCQGDSFKSHLQSLEADLPNPLALWPKAPGPVGSCHPVSSYSSTEDCPPPSAQLFPQPVLSPIPPNSLLLQKPFWSCWASEGDREQLVSIWCSPLARAPAPWAFRSPGGIILLPLTFRLGPELRGFHHVQCGL